MKEEEKYEKKISYPGILTAKAETGLDLQLGWNYDPNQGKEVYARIVEQGKVVLFWFPEGVRPHWSTFVEENRG